MAELDFARPGFLYMLFILIPIIVWYIYKNKHAFASMQMSTIEPLINSVKSYKTILRHILFGLRLLAIAALIIALARPQSTDTWENVDTLGIDIMLSIDISGSMLARDFKPDRLEAAKDVAIEFISGRKNDRMGLVVFSGESFTQCPLTTDHAVLINLFRDIKSGMIEDGTAIGVGLSNAINRLKDSEAISKVIILLTDGVNNQGVIDPTTAAELAKAFDIRVYTVGVGTIGEADYPVGVDVWGNTVFRKLPVEIDEATLQKISDMTGGKYFRATSNSKLREIYQEIDQLEKSKINVKEYSRKEERFMPFVWLALLFVLIEIVLQKTVLRSIP
ncbi:MAG: VWA domain-containing protein [Bacteroidales bacterium]|nr:VWA domain-containing protein [Bacteroidales bacterium]MBN2820150.1 VWA domain-containing protein [Bacteroidales bacterium]